MKFLGGKPREGAPDGVGGAIKRTADRLISQGNDIPDGAALYQMLKTQTTIKLFFVEATAVEATAQPPPLPTVPGTMKLHQLITDEAGVIMYRDVGCFCSRAELLNCACFGAKKFMFPMEEGNTDLSAANDGATSSADTAVTANEADQPVEGAAMEALPLFRLEIKFLIYRKYAALMQNWFHWVTELTF